MEFDSDLGAETLKFIYRDSFSFGCLVFVEWTSPADYATRPRNEFKSGFASVHFNVVTGVRKVLPSHFMLSSLIVLIIQLERIQICVCFGSIISPPPSLSSRPSGVCYRSVFIAVRCPLFPRGEFTNGRIPLRIAKVFPLFLHSKS